MNAEELLDEAIARIRAEVVPAFPREALAARLQRYEESRACARIEPRWGVGNRRWRILAAGALAAGIIACAVWLVSALGGGTAIAFADVKNAVGSTQTVSFRILHFSNDPSYLRQFNIRAGEPAVTHVVCSGNRLRSEQP